MSKDQVDTYLRYGQGILLRGYKPQKDPLEGALTVKGFADTKGYYETIEDILYFKNYRTGIFEFLPAGNFQINDELLKLTQKVVDTENEQFKRNSQIQALIPRSQSEKNQFDLTIKSKKKSTIKFGDYMILRHVDSDTYLSGTIRPSEGSNGAFSVEVSNKLSRFLIFQILPYRSFESESMQIPFSSPVLIKNIANNGYLTFEKVGMNSGENEMHKVIERKPTESDQSYRIPVKTDSQNSKKYQLVTHFADLSLEDQTSEQTSPMPWIFQLHFKDVDNLSLVQHDIVYLQHTKNHGILSAVGQDIVLKELKEDNEGGLAFYQSLWEIQKHTITNRAYILRHLMSGMTLGIRNNNQQEPQQPMLVDISAGSSTPLGVIQLKLAKKQGGVINSDSFVAVSWGQYTLDINQQQEQDSESIRKSTFQNNELISRRQMKKLAKKQLEYEVKKLKFTEDISKHCFIIQQIDDDLKKQLLFALSFHSTIINLKEDLQYGAVEATKKISYLRMMKVTQKIAEIIDFLKQTNSMNPQKQFILPSTKRQLICKNLGLSELLFQLLFFMRENMIEDIFKDKINQHQKFVELYQTIYEVIINLIMNNYLFKIHITQWIMFIFVDVIEKDEDIYFRTLMELLKDNSFFVENFVTGDLITYLLDKMLKGKQKKQFCQKKYIDILRKFCICGQTIISSNQVLILRSFIDKLQDTPQGSLYQLKLVLKDEKVYCIAALNKKKIKQHPFDQFQQICKSKDENGHIIYPLSWQYYLAYLNLLADLTQGRSKQIQHFMLNQLPLDMMTQLFDKYQLNQLEVPIIKVFHYLYFQNQNFYPIQLQNRIIDYQTIQEKDINVNHFTCQVCPWETLSRVLDKILVKLSAAEPILPRFKLKNQVLFALLSITRQTLNLGFWDKKQNLEQIYQNVRNILKPHSLIDYQEVTKIKQQNTLMIQCKIQCVNIIDLIIHQDIDMNLQILNKVFKRFEFPESAANFSIQIAKLLEVPQDTEFADIFLENYRESLKNYQNIVREDLYEQVLQLAKYRNAELTKKSLSVFQKVFQGQKNRLENFYSQLYICEQNRIKFAKFLSQLSNKFFTLEDFNAPMITYQNQDNNYFLIYKKQTGVMQDLHLINQLMKNQKQLDHISDIPDIDDSQVFKNLATDRLMNFTNQRKSSNLSKQKLVAATNIHYKVLTYVKNCSNVPESQLASKLLHLCYKFLVGLIQNHQQIKLDMLQHLPKIMRHIGSNIGCLDLLKQMYDNNKSMLFNQSEINILIRNICQVVDKQPEDTYYRSKLLDFLRYLIYLNNKPLKINQILILKIMQDDDFKKLIKIPNPEQIQILVSEYHEQNGKNYQFPSNYVICSPELIYLTTYFQILTSLVDQNNRVNAGKLERNFPFDGLLDTIKAADNCFFLKRNIRAFLNRLYYFSAGTDAYLSQILKEDIIYIIKDLDQLITLKHRSDLSRIQSLKFENPVRFTFFESYLYLNLEQILFTLNSILNKKQLFDEIVGYLSTVSQSNMDTCQAFIRIAERLGWLRNYFTAQKNVSTTAVTKFLQSRIKLLLDNLPIQVYQSGIKEDLSKSNDEQIHNKYRNYMVTKIMHGNIGQFFKADSINIQRDLPLSFLAPDQQIYERVKKQADWSILENKLHQIFTRKRIEFETIDQQVNYKMDKIVSGLKMARSTQQKILKSFQTMLFSTTQNQVQLLDFLHILIQINNQEPDLLTQDQKIFILKILTSIFQNTNTPIIKKQSQNKQSQNKQSQNKQSNSRKQIDQWQADDWQKNQKQIQKVQMLFKKYGVGQFITTLAKGAICQNIKLANYMLLCGISYLLGGNKQTQNDIREKLNQDTDNKVFKNIRALMIKLGGLIRKCVDEDRAHLFQKQDQYIDQFLPNTIDNYDFYVLDEKFMTRKNVEEPHYTDQALYYQQCIITYRRAFKFMQLLCQNNNIDNKNFIRQQLQTGQPIDFIQIATKQLRNIFQVVCVDIAEIPIFILDFILEVTQIPVAANQQAFIKSSFFQDLCLLDNTLKKEGQLANRGFGSDEAPINLLFQKSIQIILSNLQGGDTSNFKLLDQKLQQPFLVKLLQKKLEQIRITNKKQFEQYIQKLTAPHPVKNTDEGQKNIKQQSNTTFDEAMCGILEIMIIFMKLRDILGNSSKLYNAYKKQRFKEEIKGSGKNWPQVFQALEKCLLKIQIADDSGNQQYVYFPNHPVFNSLSDGLRDYVMLNVLRGTHREKIITLLGFVSGIKQKIQQSYYFEKCQKLSEKDMIDSYASASRISIFLCLYMALFYQIFIENGGASFGTTFSLSMIRFLIGLFQFYFSVKYIYIWLKIRIWYTPQSVNRQKKEIINLVEHMLDQNMQQPSSNILSQKNISQQQPLKQQQQIKKIGWAKKIKSYIEYAYEYYQSQEPKFYDSSDFYKIFLFVLVSFVGTFFYPPILFIHILDYVCNSPVLGTIFQAISKVTKPLLLVGMMGVVFTFIFCTVTLGNYVQDLYAEASEDETCDGMIGCILGLFVSGVIGQTMQDFQITRFTYDTIYSIFFGMLFGNIVSGLMLDTFGDLREETQELNNDKQNKCYICNVAREDLEKKSQDFASHIKQKHFLWNYIFYIIALQKKNPTDYTGLEYYISQKYDLPDEEMDVTWMPDGEQVGFDIGQAAEEMTKHLQAHEEEMKSSIQELDKRIEQFNSLTASG